MILNKGNRTKLMYVGIFFKLSGKFEIFKHKKLSTSMFKFFPVPYYSRLSNKRAVANYV